ncbi:MAG: sulfatase-like hydrolase/transferase, partial [Clostridiales Family XIII bacterium]|nr:sulfatase-like hydrolase/transferase [Clostridiales Family XIII bacterium]
MPNEAKKWIAADVALILLLFLVLNPFQIAFVSALSAREWTLFHLSDLVQSLSAGDAAGAEEYYLATGSYETQEKNEYFGAARGKNIIVVQLESFQNMTVGARYNGEEITPRINAWLREEGMLYFDHFYQQVASGNTSDAEFAVKNSNIGTVESYTYQIYDENYFRGLPWLLSGAGYRTMVMHGYDKGFWNRENMYRAEGIDRFYSDADYVNDRIEGIGGGNISG